MVDLNCTNPFRIKLLHLLTQQLQTIHTDAQHVALEAEVTAERLRGKCVSTRSQTQIFKNMHVKNCHLVLWEKGMKEITTVKNKWL